MDYFPDNRIFTFTSYKIYQYHNQHLSLLWEMSKWGWVITACHGQAPLDLLEWFLYSHSQTIQSISFSLFTFPVFWSELFSNMIYDSLCSFILEAKYNFYYFGRISASFLYLHSSNNRDIAKVSTVLRFIISALIKNFADATTRE